MDKRRILIVEDEGIVGFDLQGILQNDLPRIIVPHLKLELTVN
jgi:hypothetical protein